MRLQKCKILHLMKYTFSGSTICEKLSTYNKISEKDAPDQCRTFVYFLSFKFVPFLLARLHFLKTHIFCRATKV